MTRPHFTRTHRILVGVVVTGAVLIAGIGFVGSYAAVRELAERKGFGWFAVVFPVGIDAGIVVLLALDLLLTWIRIPFPLLRQAAWLLTAATVAFNGAAAWPDLLGVGMHAVIPLLFIAAVEAARHAVGRIADITADRHMESVRVARWLLAFPSTFRLWRRMKLWELRSYEQVIALERDRLVYRARLRAAYGRAWRRRAPVEALMPLKLARFGVPITETAPAGLAAAGLEPGLPPSGVNGYAQAEKRQQVPRPRRSLRATLPQLNGHSPIRPLEAVPMQLRAEARIGNDEMAAPDGLEPASTADSVQDAAPKRPTWLPDIPRRFSGARQQAVKVQSAEPTRVDEIKPSADRSPTPPPAAADVLEEHVTAADRYYAAWHRYITDHGVEPTGDQFSAWLADHDVTGRGGRPVSPGNLRRYLPEFRYYAAWSRHVDEHGEAPSAEELSQLLAELGITRNGVPVTASVLEPLVPDFHRRRSVEASILD